MNFDNDNSRKKKWGLLVTGVVGGTLVALYAVATPFITPALRKICLPFVPATSTQIENVLKMLQCRNGSLVDIGSGDGRIVIAAAKEGFRAVGYELNPWLVWYSRYCAWREGVHHDAKFYISDLWKVRFSQYTNVVIFGVPQLMPQLEKKLEDELEHDARVIACRFPFPHWMPDYTTAEIPNRSYHFFVLKMLVDTEKGRLTLFNMCLHDVQQDTGIRNQLTQSGFYNLS
ncbi:protein FAM173B [Alligator mississippiensis]|uniref:ATP synthase subunit C lysine N-methyltransferase n=1 Tax=Alligator mississippiensis TaxID=8496 RepID=A0A151NCY0_ALLMI|nr:protein FAM173B [Alligator mississippiensis]